MFSKVTQETQGWGIASRPFHTSLSAARMQDSLRSSKQEVSPVDVGEFRRINLLALLHVNGETQADFARRMDTAPAYVSQILNRHGDRRMGRNFARRIERTYMLEHGWMDHDHTRAPYQEDRTVTAAAQAMAKRFDALPEPMKAHIRALMDQILNSERKTRKKK